MITCPKCGSRFLRPSRPRTTMEWWGKMRLIDPLRCVDCKTRFVSPTIVWADLRYARCPDCHRMDLNGWTGKTYDAPLWMSVMITMGASRYRCEYCRINFASFRKRKEVFSFSRWKKMGMHPGETAPVDQDPDESRNSKARG